MIFHETEIAGDARTDFRGDTLRRIGRALGTLARRRGMEKTLFVVGREDHQSAAQARDLLVQGLLLSGHRVSDVGLVDGVRHEFALNELVAPGGVRCAVSERDGRPWLTLEIFLGGGPLVGAGLRALNTVLEEGDFSSGIGALEIVDIEPAYRRAKREGLAGSFKRDTVVL